MKIIKYIIFSIIVFLSCFSFASAKENVLEDVVLKETSGKVSTNSVTVENDIINPTITFKELNDSVTYELFLNYDKEIYEIDKIMDDNENDFIKTSYSIVGDKVFMMIKYENAVEGEFELKSIKIQIKLKEKSVNPKTGFENIFPIILILVICIGNIVFIKKKKVFILLFLLIPVLVYAKEDTILEIGLSSENIKISYTVEFYSGDEVTGSIEDIECIYGEECTLPVNTLEKEDNTFKGWSLEPGGEILYLDEAKVLDLISSGKVTLYPVWARLYTIEFNGNGSTSGLMSSIICVEGEECILPENEFVKMNYTFAGWANSSDGEILYTNQEELIDLNDNLALYAKWVITITNFYYTGASQTYTVPVDGRYKLEVWGAQGGLSRYNSYIWQGGKGGYSYGTININQGLTLYVYVGGQGAQVESSTTAAVGGFNGGGEGGKCTSYLYIGGSGGGASDIRINSDSLYARVIVAAGGGGAGYGQGKNEISGGTGGGLEGGIGTYFSSYSARRGSGGSQTEGGSRGISGTSAAGYSGTFGIGGNGASGQAGGGGGGGGWYGGGGGADGAQCSGSAGGGSGYVYTSSSASNYPSGCLLNSSYYLSDAQTIAGNTSFISPSGESEIGHPGNGYARITYLGQ